MVIKLSFICDIRDTTGLAMMHQCEHLHARQKAFVEIMEYRPVYALQYAYTFDTRLRVTLSDGIMVMTHSKSGREFFHSLDQPLGAGCNYQLTCIQSHGEEAGAVIYSLTAYLAHQRGTWVYTHVLYLRCTEGSILPLEPSVEPD
jgi:hypothetical protein